MKKVEMVKKLLDIKIIWWSIVENHEYTDEQRTSLHKVLWSMKKEDIQYQISCYEQRIQNAKSKLTV
jgi:hypothetical protein